MSKAPFLLCFFLTMLACGRPANAEAAQKLQALADDFVNQTLSFDPTLAYEAGIATAANDRFSDRSPAALAAFEQKERDDLLALRQLDVSSLPPGSMAVYANLREKLESDLQLRVCRTELWNVNHFDGWQSQLADVASAQPVDTAEERRQALRRWASLPAFVAVEIDNLKRGLAQNYSAPKSVVLRVIRQMDELASAPPESSPFYSPASRTGDRAFKAAFKTLVQNKIDPALIRYRDFLRSTYLAKARESVAVSDLPNGPACYSAFLRAETTLDRPARAVFELGRRTVAANTKDVLAIGHRLYGTRDLEATLASAKSASGEHFSEKSQLLAFSRDFLNRTKSRTAETLINRLPGQDVVVEPERAFEEAGGVSSHLDVQPDKSKPAVYRIELGNWANETRAEAEITAVHETLPGHHLQIALARELAPATSLSKLLTIPAYQEGWARYAEGLAEEAGIYDLPEAAILRRVWPARGMVVDPGIHAFHWSREQAIQYLVSTGRFTRKSADDEVDRIAVMPGQLTAYDSGALEIKALRTDAQRRLGRRFDLKQFNQVVLEEGVVPLSELKRHVSAWLDSRTLH